MIVPSREAWRQVTSLTGHSTQQNNAFTCLAADGWSIHSSSDEIGPIGGPMLTGGEARYNNTLRTYLNRAGVLCEIPEGPPSWKYIDKLHVQSYSKISSQLLMEAGKAIITANRTGLNYDVRWRREYCMPGVIAVGGSTKTGGDDQLGWGFGAIEMIDCHPQNDSGKSYSQFSIPAKATILADHPSVNNWWDVRRLLRMSSGNYATGWVERTGWGMPLPRNFSSTWNDMLGDLYTVSAVYPVTQRNSYTDVQLDDLVGQIMANEQAKVEPPVAARAEAAEVADINGNYMTEEGIVYTGYNLSLLPIWDGDPLENEGKFRWLSAKFPDNYYTNNQVVDNGLVVSDESTDLGFVSFTWVNFKSSQWKSTLITVNDNVIYEGTDNKFMWPCNVSGPAIVRWYSRAIDGSLSREEHCTKMELIKLRKLAAYSGSYGSDSRSFKSQGRRTWIPKH